MKNIIAFIWIMIFVQIIGFIGANLTHTQYSASTTFIVSLIFGVIFMIVPKELEHFSKKL